MRSVLIGSSNSGKTSLLNKLSERGYNTEPEVPRRVLENYPNASTELKQIMMFNIQIGREETEQDTIYERGLPDIAVYTLEYCPHSMYIINHDLKNRYDAVFHLHVPKSNNMFNDGLRIEKDQEEANRINDNVLKAYKNLGYKVIEVDQESLEERVEFVSGKLKELGFKYGKSN